MAHWHSFNPWAARLTYISLEDLIFLKGQDYIDRNITDNGYKKADAYLLANPDYRYSLGIRYGKEGREYLSPSVCDTKAASVWEKYQ